ncbi:hypothetical protein O181_075750 [Austropuccinia psidii MF-1]|uniref:Uncharacterized protein n=1 Tax=Austropuccinia psidii MF-1 TaxID=1389203 RepID=A0A9Q3IEB5_9BASI|nr:hypothetical protein [Austropuccinia psidii MF-1]
MRTPERQRTDSGGAEGEDLVSSVIVQDPFGAELISQDLPFNFGEARILMVLDPLNGSRPWATFLVPSKIGPRGPSIAPTDCRPQHTVEGQWTADHRTPRTQEGQKGHKITKSKNAPKTQKRPKGPQIQFSSKVTIGRAKTQKDSDHILGHFQGYWGQDPLEEFFQDNSSKRKEGPNIRRAQWHSFWDTTQGHAPKGRTD